MDDPEVTRFQGDLASGILARSVRAYTLPLELLLMSAEWQSSATFDQCTTTSDKVWTLEGLQALHELRVPVAVVVPGISQAPHRCWSQARHRMLRC